MHSRRTAFTLIELIVTIALIALLLGILIVAVGGVRKSAERASSLGALRQITAAYNGYAQDHSGRLMPGYIDVSLMTNGAVFENITGQLPDGTVIAPPDLQSYVWRLAPYLDDTWATLFADSRDRGAVEAFAADYGNGALGPSTFATAFPGGIAERPTYGLNSIYVGGDSKHGGSFVATRHPWNTDGLAPIAITRLSQAKAPGKIIVFAPSAKAANSPDDVYEDPGVGFCELHAPYLPSQDGMFEDLSLTWDTPQWSVGLEGRVRHDASGLYTPDAGLPIVRSGRDELPIGNLDGSTGVENLPDLSRDMRRWAPREVQLRRSVEPAPP